MSSNGNANYPPWQPPPHLRTSLDSNSHSTSAFVFDSLSSAGSRPRTPALPPDSGHGSEGDFVEEDPRVKLFKEAYSRTEVRLNAMYRIGSADSRDEDARELDANGSVSVGPPTSAPPSTARRAARTIVEDDYDDDYDDEEDSGIVDASPLKGKGASATTSPEMSKSLLPKRPSLPAKYTSDLTKAPGSQERVKTVEEVRKKLEDDKKAAEDAARLSFHTRFYTLDNDRDAMLEQQKLDELDRQVDAEMSGGHAGPGGANAAPHNGQHGKLSNANLGASSLTLKHLIARIDSKRDVVRSTDAELRSLMSEVRKNRSKWANEERVGQEELYEAAEKVLNELKAHTEHSSAFLARVNKKDAHDYYNIIKQPMDLGTMTKKLKSVAYKSKKEFVDDIQLIWSNCLKYNAEPNHFLRKHALAMRKETEKLVPLIPDIVIRDRAEVEAEERRLQNADGENDGGEDSDDEPIMSSRGRAATGKTTKKGASVARKAPSAEEEGTPSAESKPPGNLNPNSSAMSRTDFLRADSDAPHDGSVNGLSTPPLGAQGSLTPAGPNGLPPATFGSQADAMEIDGPSINGLGMNGGPGEVVVHEDLEYKTWKQVTKKDRALVAAERHRLFKGDKINPEEKALLRHKSGMRRWERREREAVSAGQAGASDTATQEAQITEAPKAGETLAEGMEGEDERVLPDYYDPLSFIPEIPYGQKWIEDSEGEVVDQLEQYLRVAPRGQFLPPDGLYRQKVDNNIRQMQETRKLCSKVGVVKQMQIQSQMYSNQFQKYHPEPFVEKDIPPHVMSDDGPIVDPGLCRVALQRSVGKIFYQAGFEEFQPSALDVITDLAGAYFTNLVQTLETFRETSKVSNQELTAHSSSPLKYTPHFAPEEIVLHALHESGHEIQALDSYVTEDIDRQKSKMAIIHQRMKTYLADLLRPALADGSGDGSASFNDGSEQFVSGDFAEELDADFFGFRELGLDKEFGLSSLSVPLHLLQNRMHSQYQANLTSNADASIANLLDAPPPYGPVTLGNLSDEIGLVRNFFLAKLHANGDEPLIEDDDLPQKQRFPKPRLPPSGKISSPRKRPPKEQQGNKNKKRKVDANPPVSIPQPNQVEGATIPSRNGSIAGPPIGKLKLTMPAAPVLDHSDSARASDADREDGGLLSPESMEAAAA
ncbi:MAG: Transcriptional activator spt7 [Vezdaea aestivalis]|nr:MAG: Transcriptional activator spt7 [Vezdaea aestivalis]